MRSTTIPSRSTTVSANGITIDAPNQRMAEMCRVILDAMPSAESLPSIPLTKIIRQAAEAHQEYMKKHTANPDIPQMTYTYDCGKHTRILSTSHLYGALDAKPSAVKLSCLSPEDWECSCIIDAINGYDADDATQWLIRTLQPHYPGINPYTCHGMYAIFRPGTTDVLVWTGHGYSPLDEIDSALLPEIAPSPEAFATQIAVCKALCMAADVWLSVKTMQ